MTAKPKPKRRVSLVGWSYQPNKKELEETGSMLDLPEGTAPEHLAKGVVTPLDIDWYRRHHRVDADAAAARRFGRDWADGGGARAPGGRERRRYGRPGHRHGHARGGVFLAAKITLVRTGTPTTTARRPSPTP